MEKKWLDGSTGLKNDPDGRQVFPLAGTPLGKFLATLLHQRYIQIYLTIRERRINITQY